MKKILISACLLGQSCRYDGCSKPCQAAIKLSEMSQVQLIPICPEVDGGLPTPRPASERNGKQVINCNGQDVTTEYQKGAELALNTALSNGCELAILKEKSPSCGKGQIYDGSFTRTLMDGNGVTAEMLLEHHIRVIGETEIESEISAWNN